MAFKLIESAQTRWRAVNAPHLVALVRAGAVFKNGKLIVRPDESEGGDQQVAGLDYSSVARPESLDHFLATGVALPEPDVV